MSNCDQATSFCGKCRTIDGCVCATKPTKTTKRSPTRVKPRWQKFEANAEKVLRRHGHDLPWNRGPGADTWGAAVGAIVESVETERKACIVILEDMRPRNDPSDWNEFTVTTDTILRLAIEAISARCPA